VLADDEEEPEDQLAILEELERQEIELEQEAARKIQVRLPTLNGHFALKVTSRFEGEEGPNQEAQKGSCSH